MSKLNRKTYASIEIIEDVETAETETTTATTNTDTETHLQIETSPKNKKCREKKPQHVLDKFYTDADNIFEIGADEAGRGPLFGRVYSGAVILPKDDSFDHSKMKDSKKFHSKTKIVETAEYIKQHALAWGIGYESETVIDNINILQATQQSMHKAISNAIAQFNSKDGSTQTLTVANTQLLIDGNYFKPFVLNNQKCKFVTVEGGDNTYSSIAAASILAKVARDEYIDELCEKHPFLSENYGIDSNKGYGAKRHMDGIKEHGITQWHRKSFGICKKY